MSAQKIIQAVVRADASRAKIALLTEVVDTVMSPCAMLGSVGLRRKREIAGLPLMAAATELAKLKFPGSIKRGHITRAARDECYSLISQIENADSDVEVQKIMSWDDARMLDKVYDGEFSTAKGDHA